ncbi:MAG: hypothetical protein K0R67_1962 [Paenibacillus sp.]|nr:hypothetical protein [Paenibacillus sp.]
MSTKPRSIPRPLVRVNQWVIVLSVVAAWLSGLYWILAIPLAAGLLGLFTGFNPVIRLARLFLRKPASSYIPEDWNEQQFNQTIAVVCLSVGLVSYIQQWTTTAYIFTALVGTAAFVAILGFCVGCFMRYQLLRLRRAYKS